jgi:hypothetical protein
MWVCLFVILGIVLLIKSFRLNRIVSRFEDLEYYSASDRERVLSAAARREHIENACWWKAAVPGLLALLYAVVLVLNPAEEEQPLLWAMFCLATAAIMASIYLKMRSRNYVRVAPLTARSPLNVIPPLWFAVTAAFALIPLVEIGRPDMLLPAVAACVASLACAALAWRVASVRAFLCGEDVAAESFVDERLRFIRATSILVFALVQAEIFLSLSDPLWHSPISIGARLAGIAVMLAYVGWVVRRRRKAAAALTTS